MKPLGHVRMENIYIKKRDFCVLGGYVNSIMGYSCPLQDKIKKKIEQEHLVLDIDVVMFGKG